MKIGSILDLSFSPFFSIRIWAVCQVIEREFSCTYNGGGGGALVCNKKVNMKRMTRVTMK